MLGVSACLSRQQALLVSSCAGVPLRDMLAACTVGFLESTPLLDLNHLEEAGDGACLTLGALTNLGTVPLLQLDDKLPLEVLEKVRQPEMTA